MDVQAVTGTGSAAPQDGAIAAPAPQPAVPDGAKAGSSHAGPPPGLEPLAPVLAKIFGSAPAGAGAINVSYRVEHNPDMVVTIFTDPATGQEIAQFPSEVLVQMAQFFDKHSGVTLDRSA